MFLHVYGVDGVLNLKKRDVTLLAAGFDTIRPSLLWTLFRRPRTN